MERKESESEDDFRRGAEAAQSTRGEDEDAWSEWTFDDPIETMSSNESLEDVDQESADSSSENPVSGNRTETSPHAGGRTSRGSTSRSPTTVDGSSTPEESSSRTEDGSSSSDEYSAVSSTSPTGNDGFRSQELGSESGEPNAAADTGQSTDQNLFDEVARESLVDEPQGLFDDLLSGTPIFENKEVLRPSYTPHELPHRTEQINKMATILVAALRGETPSNILIYGKTGTGKTASAKFVSQELESTSKKYRVPCEVEYINCEVTDTQYRVLAQLANTFLEENERLIDEEIAALEARLSQYDSTRPRETTESTGRESLEGDDTGRRTETDDTIPSGDTVPSDSTGSPESSVSTGVSDPTRTGEDATEQNRFDHDDLTSPAAVTQRIEDLREEQESIESVPMTGWPTDRVYQVFFEAVDRRERVVVIMLDEIDKLVEKSGDDTLYNLSRMNSELENSRVSIIGISNDLKFTDFLDPRVKSSLGEEEIVFPPYDASQLRDILQHRADVAFIDGVLTPEVIPLCAAFAAQEHGDARRALDLLRTAGELAERNQSDVVLEQNVRQAQDKIELDRVVEVVRTLPTQSKLVLFAIILLEKNGIHTINTGEVYNIYKRLCGEIDADPLTQRRVTDLISELDMLGIANASVVSKGRYGRTKEITLSVPIDETEAVLMADSRLGDIEDVQPFVQARFDN